MPTSSDWWRQCKPASREWLLEDPLVWLQHSMLCYIRALSFGCEKIPRSQHPGLISGRLTPLIANSLIIISGAVFVSASHQTGLDTRWMIWRSIIVGIRRKEGRAPAEAQTLLDYAGHRPTKCNVGLISLARHGPKSGSRHGCLIIA